MSLEFELEEIKLHNKEDDAWVIINGRVYDVTSFMDAHPGSFILLL
jgi:cytochrome b involved in lipid metabolism